MCRRTFADIFFTKNKLQEYLFIFQVIARECMTYLVCQLPNSDSHSMPVVLKEVRSISDRYPAALPDLIGEISKYSHSAPASARAIIMQLKELCAKM